MTKRYLNQVNPSFKYSLKTRLKQRLLQGIIQDSISEPYLSQAFFRSLADAVITCKKDLEEVNKKSLPDCQILYIRSDFLEEYLTNFSSCISPSKIISGSSDTKIQFPVIDYLPDTVKSVYIQNSFVSDGKRIFTLPIGIEDLSLALNGLPVLLSGVRATKRNSILVGPFSPNNSERIELLKMFNNSSLVHVVSERMDPSSYAKLAKRFKFIACPAGNGIDTHRVWETLYRGSFPIVKKSAWSQSLKEMGIPIVEVNSWEYLESIIESFICVEPPDPTNLEMIWSHHWENTLLEDFSR